MVLLDTGFEGTFVAVRSCDAREAKIDGRAVVTVLSGEQWRWPRPVLGSSKGYIEKEGKFVIR